MEGSRSPALEEVSGSMMAALPAAGGAADGDGSAGNMPLPVVIACAQALAAVYWCVGCAGALASVVTTPPVTVPRASPSAAGTTSSSAGGDRAAGATSSGSVLAALAPAFSYGKTMTLPAGSQQTRTGCLARLLQQATVSCRKCACQRVRGRILLCSSPRSSAILFACSAAVERPQVVVHGFLHRRARAGGSAACSHRQRARRAMSRRRSLERDGNRQRR